MVTRIAPEVTGNKRYQWLPAGDEHTIGIKTCSTLKTLSIMFGECLKSTNFAIELEIEGVIGKGVALL